MNSSKQITVTALILFIIGSLSGNAIGQRLGGDDEKTETLVLGTLAFVGLVVYDIATAPSSAKHYNEGLRDMFPLIEDRRFVGSGAYTFGQPGFSRAALVKDNSQAIFCELQKSNKKEKSPTTALLWSLGATVIPSAVGLGVVALRNWDFTTYWVVISSALVFGPSAGHFYSGKVVRGSNKLGDRTFIRESKDTVLRSSQLDLLEGLSRRKTKQECYVVGGLMCFVLLG